MASKVVFVFCVNKKKFNNLAFLLCERKKIMRNMRYNRISNVDLKVR